MGQNPGLEPCPQCAGTVKTRLENRRWQVVCEKCGYGAQMWYQSVQLAVDVWNHSARAQRPEVTDDWHDHTTRV